MYDSVPRWKRGTVPDSRPHWNDAGVRESLRPGAARGLVPAVVANLDVAVLDTHRKLCCRLVRRCGKRLPGADAESRAVPWADDLVALHRAASQLAAVVGADIFDGVVLAAHIEHDHRRV